ncbi:glycoside hydrolase family 2 protein [Microbacterium sp. STN6]|uniref:glycoside hydrolase family 2 protein n=1 Tax=Microbacterium sp. STN6 TaxID=2995588 RepID=UPI0022608D05|nr:glycoside hydrolase family 2 protein [Microbacterium sp. STN6]MCX7522481.1 glycoside hydrolase family 2 protein [Microbacterium sp. STN6]
MSVLSLDSDAGTTWSLRATAGPVPAELASLMAESVPATVPGEVQTDLMAAGLIPDPFDGDNESRTAWIGYCDWQYSTTFTWHADGEARHDLVADGLDTAASIRLNGREVARTQNQHRSYRFEVGGFLVDGENELVVEFRSPIEFAREQEKVLGALPTVMHHPFNAIRKMASNFGWDWGIDVSSSGIWKSMRLESWSVVRIASVRPLIAVEGGSGTLTAHVGLEWADAGTGRAGAGSAAAPDTRQRPAGGPAAGGQSVTVTVAGQTATASVLAGDASVVVGVEAGAVELWWPRGHGAQPLYPVEVAVADDVWRGRVGFRTVEIDTAPDEHGSAFTFVVNGKRVFVRGANWIPDDAFLTRMTRERYRSAIADAVDANMNLLRVWGGGIYESDDFYDACDEAGVLVWQDFLFACAAYAEEDPLRTEVEAEAREAITRLSAHPSLALWNGCNENIWGYLEWGWRPQLAGRTWGEGYYVDLLPSLVAELDPTRPYSPGSPFSFTRYAHPNDERLGTMHIWDVWNERDYSVYGDYRPRFASEFGFQGPPAYSTLTEVVHDEPLEPYGPQLLVHQKAADGNLKLERGLGAHLPQPRDFDEWHWATQLNQARAVAFGIEHFRSLYPLNQGAIVWQLNDDWPVVSWAAVDSHGHRKPLWHALRRVYADRLLTIQPADAGLALVAHNDADAPWRATVTIERRAVDGTGSLATQTVQLDAPPRGIAHIVIEADAATAADAGRELLRASADDGSGPAWWFFVEDPELELAGLRDALQASARRTETGYEVRVTARSLVKDLTLQADRLDPRARVDSALITLQAGETHTFVVTSDAALEPERLLAFPVLCSVNDLVTA